MKIFVFVKPGTNEERIEKVSESIFKVWVKEQPIKGRANLMLIKVLAEYFKIPNSQVNIISGYKSRKKIISLNK